MAVVNGGKVYRGEWMFKSLWGALASVAWLSIVPGTQRSLVQFLVRVCARFPVWSLQEKVNGCFSYQCFFLSLALIKKKKYFKKPVGAKSLARSGSERKPL